MRGSTAVTSRTMSEHECEDIRARFHLIAKEKIAAPDC